MVDPNPVPCGAGDYRDCKITKKVTGGAAADYEFECTTPQGQKKKVTAKGTTINDNAARQMCCNGDFDP
jgi:hypothetical protein